MNDEYPCMNYKMLKEANFSISTRDTTGWGSPVQRVQNLGTDKLFNCIWSQRECGARGKRRSAPQMEGHAKFWFEFLITTFNGWSWGFDWMRRHRILAIKLKSWRFEKKKSQLSFSYLKALRI